MELQLFCFGVDDPIKTFSADMRIAPETGHEVMLTLEVTEEIAVAIESKLQVLKLEKPIPQGSLDPMGEPKRYGYRIKAPFTVDHIRHNLHQVGKNYLEGWGEATVMLSTNSGLHREILLWMYQNKKPGWAV